MAKPPLLPLFPSERELSRALAPKRLHRRCGPHVSGWIFPGTFPLHGPRAPCVPRTAALLAPLCPARFSQQLSRFPGMLPAREVLGANDGGKIGGVGHSPTCLPPMALFGGAQPVATAPQQFF